MIETTLWQQTTIFGEKLPLNESDPERPPEGVCVESCYMAKEEKCSCRCNGAYHGLGKLNKRTKKSLDEATEDSSCEDSERSSSHD